MTNFIKTTANFAAIVGVLICILSGLLRLLGNFYIAGFELLTLYYIGLGMMIFSGLLKLEVILKGMSEPSSQP